MTAPHVTKVAVTAVRGIRDTYTVASFRIEPAVGDTGQTVIGTGKDQRALPATVADIPADVCAAVTAFLTGGDQQ